MICANCGFQNAPGDEFCGSCGQFLAWTGRGDAPAAPAPAAPDVAGAESPTVITPPSPPAPLPAAGAWSANLQRCDACGTANELSRTFCLNCGAELKKTGTTNGAMLAAAATQEQHQNGVRLVAYAVGGALIFVLAAAVAFAALGGFGRGAPAPLPASSPGSLLAANPGASLGPSAPAISTVAPATDQPIATLPVTQATITPTPATAPPDTAPPATAPPATAPPAGGFLCTASTFSAVQPGGWKIFHAHWSRHGPADALFLEMEPATSGSTASVDANIMPPDQVQPTYGVPGPSSGNVAVVLAFNDAVSLSGQFGSPVGYKALQEFQIYRSGGRVLVVMGVNGTGCYGLSSDAWTSGSSTSPELAVALQH